MSYYEQQPVEFEYGSEPVGCSQEDELLQEENAYNDSCEMEEKKIHRHLDEDKKELSLSQSRKRKQDAFVPLTQNPSSQRSNRGQKKTASASSSSSSSSRPSSMSPIFPALPSLGSPFASPHNDREEYDEKMMEEVKTRDPVPPSSLSSLSSTPYDREVRRRQAILKRFTQELKKRKKELLAEDEKNQDGDLWPARTPLEVVLAYVKEIGLITTDTPAQRVVDYVVSWEFLNRPARKAQMIELAFCDPKMADVSRLNFAFCDSYLEFKGELEHIPFGKRTITNDEYLRRIKVLTKANEDNVDWFRKFQYAKDARASGIPMRHFYDAPLIDDESAANVARDSVEDEPQQKLLAHLFSMAGADGLRRSDTQVFRLIRTKEGLDTRCYEYYMDIMPWTVRQIDQRHYPDQYATWTSSKGNVSSYIARHLMSGLDAKSAATPDPRFPFVVRNRTWFSFQNAVYDAHNNILYPYVDDESLYSERVRPIAELGVEYSTANYFDCAIPFDWFRDGFDPRTIPVPNHEKIFKSQKYTQKDIDWVQALCGRLQHDIDPDGELEDWQIALFFKGPGKTGKSCFLKLLQLWYSQLDVGLIGDDVEKTFQDQHLINKFIVICMDISGDFGLTPTRFLSWVSGDWLNVLRKYKEAISVQWKAPVVFGSNGDPPVATSGGAGPRRWGIFPFNHAIATSDGKLFAKAKLEIGFHLIKCSMLYHEKCKLHGAEGLWDNRNTLPAMMWRAREEYTKASSWPDAFLQNGDFTYSEGARMDVYTFQEEFAMFKTKTTKLRGVSNKKQVVEVNCTALEFANALNDFPGVPVGTPADQKPYWYKDPDGLIDDMIMNLKFVPLAERIKDTTKSKKGVASTNASSSSFSSSSSSSSPVPPFSAHNNTTESVGPINAAFAAAAAAPKTARPRVSPVGQRKTATLHQAMAG